MEVREVVGVIRKHWIVAAIGLVLAIGLGYETYAHRADAKYSSNATIFVTQGNFPSSVSAATSNSGTLTGLAYLYAQIAQSDLIRQRIGAPLNSITATVVTTGADSTGSALPFIFLTTTAKSSTGATHLTEAATAALQRYVVNGEASARTPSANRVNLQVITAPTVGKALTPKTRVVLLPGVVLLTVLLATLGVIFVIENLSRSPRTAAGSGTAFGERRSRWLPGRAGESEEALRDQAAMSKALRQQ